MNLADFGKAPKSYAFRALRRKQPVETPLGKLQVELHLAEDRNPPDAKLLELAAELVDYAQSHIDYVWDLIYGSYRYWVTVKADPGWLPYSDVPIDLTREQIPGYCEILLVVSRHLDRSKVSHDTEICVAPKWDNGESLTLKLRNGAVVEVNDSPFKFEKGILRVLKEKPPSHKPTKTDQGASDFKKLPTHTYPMARHACRRLLPLETPLGKAQVELHIMTGDDPPDDKMLKLAAALMHYVGEHSEYVGDLIYGAYRYWIKGGAQDEEGTGVPTNLKREQVPNYCEVRLVVTRLKKQYDSEIWLLPNWGQEHNLIMKYLDGRILTANEMPFKLEKGVLKFLKQGAGLLGGLLDSVSEFLQERETKEERKQAAAEELQHPVFGRLVRTDWCGLLTFRVFPFLRQFGDPDPRAADGKSAFKHLEKEERKVVENWANSTAKLAAISNRGLVSDCLRSFGVFELSVAVPDDGLPTPAQEAAYQHFLAQEQEVCANVLDALIRYYHFARETMPQFFDWMDQEELVEAPDAKSFARLATFRGLHVCRVCRGSSKGVAPLKFSWSPIWDDEHGLQTVLYRGQVIMIGPDADELLGDDPKGFLKEREDSGDWGPKQMTKSEKEALKALVSAYESEEES